jgi:N-acetylneuraminate 9-O-acetyltransferase
MGTNYILYYIVPLHTFYFLVVYVTMGVAQSLNYTAWGARAKIFAVAVLIYVVWELEEAVPGVFDVVFAPLSPILAERNWSLHEWHFRTFLDHYSALFGMVFAMNFPYLIAWFAAVERMPSLAMRVVLKSAVGALWLAASYWWYNEVYLLPKYEFNAAHPYWFWIPVMTFVYFRNLTPTLRSYHSALLNWLGKITLETYLLQFHIFMVAKNADGSWAPRKLLSLVPEFPLVNMLVCGLIYVACAKVSFNATLSLRDACIGELTPRDMLRALPWLIAALVGLLTLSYAFAFNDDFLLFFMALLSVIGFLGAFSLDFK